MIPPVAKAYKLKLKMCKRKNDEKFDHFIYKQSFKQPSLPNREIKEAR